MGAWMEAGIPPGCWSWLADCRMRRQRSWAAPSAWGLARLHATYGKALEETLCASLQERAWAALAEGEGRVMVLEVDGVRVAGQPHPSTHRCEGIEVKTALVYPQQAPGARTRMAGVMKPEQLLPQLSGLLRAAGVQRQDEVVGVSDGAVWIEQLYQTLGIPQVIDVFHASQYLEQVMLELGWSEEARSAIQYLEQRADRMDYPAYKARGWPIGSGQVEGMNKGDAVESLWGFAHSSPPRPAM